MEAGDVRENVNWLEMKITEMFDIRTNETMFIRILFYGSTKP